MKEGSPELQYIELRELAYADPLAAKTEFFRIMEVNPSVAVAILSVADDERGSRFRQIVARGIPNKAISATIRGIFEKWAIKESDEFALTAIRGALSEPMEPSRTRTRSALPPLAQPEETYKYVSARLRHRLLNALTPATTAVSRLKRQVADVLSAEETLLISESLDMLHNRLERLTASVQFDHEAQYFQPVAMDLISWVSQHEQLFRARYANITFATIPVTTETALVRAIPFLMDTVFDNLWKNSIDALGEAVCVVRTLITFSIEHICLLLIDNGRGFAKADTKWAFTHPHSSKDPQRGRGLMEVGEAMARMGGSVKLVEIEQEYRVQLRFKRLKQ